MVTHKQKWRIHTMQDYPALERKAILTQATTWVTLKDIMLSEVRRSHKDMSCMIPAVPGPWGSQVHRDRKQVVDAGGWRGVRSQRSLGTEFQLGMMKEVWDGWGGGCTTM